MSAELAGRTILVVEDDYLLATDLARALKQAGAQIVGPFSREEAASKMIAAGHADCALLDINLGEGPSFVLAGKMRERGMPFIFVTGYASVPDAWRDVPFVCKPVDAKDVLNEVRVLLERIQKQ